MKHLLDLRGIGLITGEVGRKLTAQLHPSLYRVFYVMLSSGGVLDM